MLTCQNCGKVLQKWDNAYFLMQVPPRSITELHAFLKHNAVAYCPECIELVRSRQHQHQNQF